MASESIPIIDSHIHLFARSHAPNLAWQTLDGPLADQYSVAEYREAAKGAPFPKAVQLKGFVVIETDYKSDLPDEGWDGPIQELQFFGRVASGKPLPGEGHVEEDKLFCLAIIGWAPVPRGREAMERYTQRLHAHVGGNVMERIVGWRYLLQDKLDGTMLQDSFVDGVKWMGEKGYVFELGIDFHRRRTVQLEEAVELIRRVNEGVLPNHRVKVVINHMGKPNMTRTALNDLPLNALGKIKSPEATFDIWKKQMKALAQFPNTYMKLSGAFSEMHPCPDQMQQEGMMFWDRQSFLLDTAVHVLPWMYTVVDFFSAERCMFGSDWPVCNIAGGGDVAFKNWLFIMRVFLSSQDRPSQDQIWGLTAAKVYKIEMRNQ